MPKLLAVSYARRSSEKGDNMRSLEYQDEANLAGAVRIGATVIESIAEDVTGTIHLRDRKATRKERREGETKRHGCDVWEMIKTKKINVLIVYRIDRLSRAETIDALALIRDIMSFGCQIFISETGEQLANHNAITSIINVWQSNEEKNRITKRLMDGKLKKAQTAWLGSGPAPYGYRKIGAGVTAQIEVDSKTSKMARWIFTQYASGVLSLNAIIDDLNRRGIKAPRGGVWWKSSLHGILKNPIYTGRVRYMGVEFVDKRLAIIKPHLWTQANDRLESNKATAPRNTQGDYLMGGRMTCYCGRRMSAKTQHKKNFDHLRYVCNYGSAPGDARCYESIAERKIDVWVNDYIKWAVSDEVLQSGIAELEQREIEAVANRTLDDVEDDLSKAQAALSRLYKAFGDSGDDDDLLAIGNAKERAATLKVEREKMTSVAQTRRVTREIRESIAARVQRYRFMLDNPTFELLRDLVLVMDVKARLIQDGAGRGVVFGCNIAPERMYRID